MCTLVPVGVLGPFVISLSGGSGTCIVCSASIVAEGGVFSPKIDRCVVCLVGGRNDGVSFIGSRSAGVGVVGLSVKGDRFSLLFMRLGVVKVPLEVGRSGERSGDRLLSK